MKTAARFAALIVTGLCSHALAQDAGVVTAPPPPAPSPEEVKRVVDYYMAGKDVGPVLVEFKPCNKVDTDKASPTQNDCLEPSGTEVKKGNVSAWMLWLVPKGAKYDDVSVQLLLDGAVRETKDVQLQDSMRTRSFRSFNLSKAGKWTLKVVRGDKELAKADLTVK